MGYLPPRQQITDSDLRLILMGAALLVVALVAGVVWAMVRIGVLA